MFLTYGSKVDSLLLHLVAQSIGKNELSANLNNRGESSLELFFSWEKRLDSLYIAIPGQH